MDLLGGLGLNGRLALPGRLCPRDCWRQPPKTGGLVGRSRYPSQGGGWTAGALALCSTPLDLGRLGLHGRKADVHLGLERVPAVASEDHS